MRRLSDYRLEANIHANDGKFLILEVVSVILKIIALVLLIIFFKRFYIAAVVWCLSIFVNLFKGKLIYKYVYEIHGNYLTVYKEYDLADTEIAERVNLKENFSFSEGEAEKKYYEEETEFVIKIRTADAAFSVAADAYFYALIDYYGSKNDIFR